MRKYQRFFRFCWLVLSLVFLTFSYYLYQFHFVHLGNPAIHFTIERGESISQIAHNLKQKNILRHPKTFAFFSRIKGLSRKAHAGEYAINANLTEADLLQHFVNGKVIMRDFTLVEGWRFNQVMQALHENPFLEHDCQALNGLSVLQRIGSEQRHPEGLFYPETYHFARGARESEVLKMAYDMMTTVLQKLWQQRSSMVDYDDPYSALIVASLVEKETAAAEERALVAGVILRRIKKNMPLQIDPTVTYGVSDTFDHQLTSKDLKKPHLYNTYLFKGLPPTPIAMPSNASIYAALHPDQGDALYFVSNGVDGRHVFSATLAEHRKAVKRYLERKKPQNK